MSDLPDCAMGPRNIVWWGNIGFMLIEGTAFLLAMAVYLYLQSESPSWPPAGDTPPDLAWSTMFTVGLFTSEALNLWVSRKAKAKDAAGVRRGTLLMALAGLMFLVVRGVELDHLNIRWDQDAYGSAVWMLMVLHTSHLTTELGESAVQSAWLHTHRIDPDQFSDVQDNCEYWTFVVLAWVPIYVLIYWVPRWT
ncbi:cytochrome c oxidase subunit 3 [Sphingomonas sp. 3P27F8]|uniref:cytochrome c oxidase subunit 3 n=1 Tax=Sphingomonas sp. 3P27F8 TaxID=2502213 RepID=UPI00201633C2|nr:cytochrome c oxidase subunit 3 [Sphingomonas sp. 3P27F8]